MLASWTALPRAAASATISHERTVAPLVILHGLFGSKQNWKSLGKAMAERLKTHVHALDLRNHGESFWSAPDEMTYDVMARDVHRWIRANVPNQRVTLLGHSMGAKVAMTMALSDREMAESIDRLVVVDMSPQPAQLSPSFLRYVQAMQSIQQSGIVTKKSEADALLRDAVPEPSVRQFLLTNLVPKSELHPTALEIINDQMQSNLAFRVNLESIARSMKSLSEFPPALITPPACFHDPTLFVYGTKADYVTDQHAPLIKRYFSRVSMTGLPAGHWHAELPQQFMASVCDFLEQSK